MRKSLNTKEMKQVVLDLIKENNKYPTYSWMSCIDAYKEPLGDYLPCPKCGLTPKVWRFNNGELTACGCWEDTYDHFSIHAESVMSIYKRTKSAIQYDSDQLRKNWNTWCQTGRIVFKHASERKDGRW